jgi:NADPH-dependent ferric siderophore reductase
MLEARRIVRRGPHPVRFRKLHVKHASFVSRNYRRIVLGGEDLDAFTSEAPDDHVKLLFPDPATGELVLPPNGPSGPAIDDVMRARLRDFTPRAFDAAKQELTVDFALHGAGIANAWAVSASPDSPLGVAGPRGSMVVPYDFDWYVLAGDEAALPAIARRLEELPKGALTFVLLEVDDIQDEQSLTTTADAHVTWLHRRGAPPGTTSLLESAIRTLDLPQGEGFVFAAGESTAIRSIRAHLADERGHRRDFQRVSAYWKRGVADFHE